LPWQLTICQPRFEYGVIFEQQVMVYSK